MKNWNTTDTIPQDRPVLVRSTTAPFSPHLDGAHVTVGQRGAKGLWTKDGLFADCDAETGSRHFTHWCEIPAFDA